MYTFENKIGYLREKVLVKKCEKKNNILFEEYWKQWGLYWHILFRLIYICLLSNMKITVASKEYNDR